MTLERSIIIAAEQALSIHSRGDIADAVGASFGSDGLVVTEDDVSKDFFVLSTGLAGELFQKFTNYRIPVAVVIKDFSSYGERFAELAREHATHPSVRFVHSTADAVEWLTSRSPA
ncbi:protein of unknown function [Dyella sp. OK004]|uniref:DUF4180 domain-containing protein n=1 Tax=Dyella sp. OK004 TaxID=1855292 RepID=UPI0008EF3D6F|nr:DUF4180 domain-containing protein [Dyella sp. OK004]SFS17174.1 protein of unknown function [Dyella sp. OK004]